jgi:hypothetical protein
VIHEFVVQRRAAIAVAALVVAVVLAALQWGSRALGGADGYAYVTEAGLIRAGSLAIHEDVVRESPWPGALGTWTPIGFRELPKVRDGITPVYPPGFPLLIALFQLLFGFCGAFWVVPICAGATVWLTYLLGRRLFEGSGIAVTAAVLVAASPVFLNQSMVVMSDVPATAAWTLALVLALSNYSFSSGLAAAAAIMIRPNLAPAAGALILWTALCDVEAGRSTGRSRWSTARVVAGIAPAVAAIAWLNAALYGSPLESGYGELQDLYSGRYLWRNVSQFSNWIAQTDTPIVALALLFFARPRLFAPARVPFARVLLGAFAAVVVASYLFYLPFDAWWYLRFLLPAWPIVMVLTAAALDAVACRVVSRHAALAVATIVLALAGHGVVAAANRSAFELWYGESRYVDVATYLGATTDPAAVFISWQHTGSIRFYADRLTLHFARLDPGWLDRAIARLQANGRRPYIVLDRGEVDRFRQRFAARNRAGALDWTPSAVTEDSSVVVYDPTSPTERTGPAVIRSSHGASGRTCVSPRVWPPRLRWR